MGQRLFYICILAISCIFSSTQFYYLNAESPYDNKPVPKWLSEQITSDLRSFSESGITKQMLDDVIAQSDPNWLLVRYQVLNNKLSITHFESAGIPMVDERLKIMTDAFNTLCLTTTLPNMDFIITLHDALDLNHIKGPIFAFAKNISSEKILLIPDYDSLRGNTKMMEEAKAGMAKYPWESKVSKAFWRGLTTDGVYTEQNFLDHPRARSVTMSLNFPKLVDARFSGLCQCENYDVVRNKFLNYFDASISITEHLQYKYQLLIDGNTSAYSRAYWQLFSNSLIMKHSSPNIQWYYRSLEPYVHYVPLKENLEDLIEKIKWANKNEKKVKRIILNAQKLANENLKVSDIYHHLYVILTEYAKLQK